MSGVPDSYALRLVDDREVSIDSVHIGSRERVETVRSVEAMRLIAMLMRAWSGLPPANA